MIRGLLVIAFGSFACSAMANGIEYSVSALLDVRAPGNVVFNGAPFSTATIEESTGLIELGELTISRPTTSANVYNGSNLSLLIYAVAMDDSWNHLAEFQARLSGVINNQLGGVSIDFGPEQVIAPGVSLSISDLTLSFPHFGESSVTQTIWGQIGGTAAGGGSEGSIDAAGVPEPSSLLLLGVSLALLGGIVKLLPRVAAGLPLP
jgi:hypothetical protein